MHRKYAILLRIGTGSGTGIAKRSPEYIAEKMIAGKAVIALEAIRW
jgi:hypothetical protein